MSIPRWHPVTDYVSVWPEPDPNGKYVEYDDHVAEVELAQQTARAEVLLERGSYDLESWDAEWAVIAIREVAL